MRAYDLISDWYSLNRDGSTGVADVERVLADIPAGAEVLDAGCGNGRPIAQMLMGRGYRVTGIDSSERILEQFRKNLPRCAALLGDVAHYDFPPRSFALIVSWGCLFHLGRANQEQALANFSRALADGGHLLFTSAKEDGNVTGVMHGVSFSYASLGTAAYDRALTSAGLTKIAEYADPNDNYVYHYRK